VAAAWMGAESASVRSAVNRSVVAGPISMFDSVYAGGSLKRVLPRELSPVGQGSGKERKSL
jgi:hypothetical protein